MSEPLDIDDVLAYDDAVEQANTELLADPATKAVLDAMFGAGMGDAVEAEQDAHLARRAEAEDG